VNRVWIAVLALCTVACGSNSSPAAPTAAGPPNVAGNYSGTVTFSYPTLGQTLTCPTQTSVTQNGSTVTISPLVFSGSCANLGSLPVGDNPLSTTGSLGTVTVNNLFVSACNGFYNVSGSGGFFGSTLQFSFSYLVQSGPCTTQLGNFTLTGNLTKQ
jgi:hypothetical protein